MPIKKHLSPKGEWKAPDFRANGWTIGGNQAKSWTYWWIEISAKNLAAAEYAILRDGAVVVPRTRLAKSPKLFAKIKFVDEEPDSPGSGPIGVAAKLDAGVHAVDFYLAIGSTAHLLRGVRFEVADRKAEEGRWQIMINPAKPKRRAMRLLCGDGVADCSVIGARLKEPLEKVFALGGRLGRRADGA